MGLINTLLDEINKRSEESEESKIFIENERARLKEKREYVKKGFIRKIKPFDAIALKVEEKKDEIAISKLEAEEAERIANERRKRRNEIVRGIFRKNKSKDDTDSKLPEDNKSKDSARNKRVTKKGPKLKSGKQNNFADTKHEAQLSEYAIVDVDLAEENSLINESVESTKTASTATNRKVVVIGSIIVALILGGFGISEARENAIIEENYNAAVQSIIDGDYSEARGLLLELDTNDSKELLKYATIMVNLNTYKDAPERLLGDLNAIGKVEEEVINGQIEDVREQVEKIKDIKEQIDALDLLNLSEASGIELDSIDRKIDCADKRWISLLNIDDYEKIKRLVDNITEQTPLGQLYLSIQDLGEISLESGDVINTLLGVYRGLSQADKEIIFNASLLSAANAEYEVLVKEQARIEQEKREAEEKARLEAEEQARKEAEEKAQQEAKEKERAARKEAWLNEDVVVTPNGTVYHLEGCSYLRKSTNLIHMTRREAQARGLPPCSRCGAGYEWYNM